jgi:hypothetical protein
MRCYLMKGGQIVAFNELSPDLTEEEAVEQGRLAFEKDPIQDLDDFEVWDCNRKVYQASNVNWLED